MYSDLCRCFGNVTAEACAALGFPGVAEAIVSRVVRFRLEAHGSEEHHDDRGKAEASHDDDHGEHEDGAHLAGAVVGVLGGLILLVGHILNIRAARRCREEGCA